MGNGPDPRVAALQLLLGDADTQTRRALIHAAFSDIATLDTRDHTRGEEGFGWLSKAGLDNTIASLMAIQRDCDGGSPLGAHAQSRIRMDVSGAATHLRGIKVLLGHK